MKKMTTVAELHAENVDHEHLAALVKALLDMELPFSIKTDGESSELALYEKEKPRAIKKK